MSRPLWSDMEAEQHSVNVSLDARIARLSGEVQALFRLIEETDKRYDMRFKNAEKAVEIAETNSERWRSNANEWRGAMDDRERKYVGKEQIDATIQAIRSEISILRDTVIANVGKSAGMDKLWGYFIAAITAAGAVGVTIAFVAK